MPKSSGESDWMKRMQKAKQKVSQQYGMYQWLIMVTATSGQDRAFLADQDPLFIVRTFIGQRCNGT
ncbi:hypothetical protein [Fodinibius sp. SL11]|uniref:hypothetical protein n=1 Tax=Fodinibius sp. SL11 TaxID=3425690 RepID=UPI003F881631